MDDREDNEASVLTDAEARDLVGKTILIGVTYRDQSGAEIQQHQMHGVVTAASPKGVEVSLRGEQHGRSLSLPPDPRVFRAASPGNYRLRATGEVVHNPALLCTADVTVPTNH